MMTSNVGWQSKVLQFLFFESHLNSIMSVISQILSITVPLSRTCTTYTPVVLIKKQLTSAVEKWTNASCHTSDSRVKERKWTSDQLACYPIICVMWLPLSVLCAHLCQLHRIFFFSNVRHFDCTYQPVFGLLCLTFSLSLPLSVPALVSYLNAFVVLCLRCAFHNK